MHNCQGVLLVLLLFFAAEGVQFCHINVASSVIQIGSPLLASCDCHDLTNETYQVTWKLDDDVIPCNQSSNLQTSTCSVYFTSFYKTSGLLQCFANISNGLQLVDQINIKAGYLPTPPTNISCLMNISKNVVNCTWQLQKDSLLEENITLSSFRAKHNCRTPVNSEYTCNPSKGDNFCFIPRKYFENFGKLSVQVTVQNKIGSATSSPLCLVPLLEVKLDPIVIKQAVSHKDCVTLQWTYGKKADFLRDMSCQLHYKEVTDVKWTGLVEIPVDVKRMDQCGLLGGSQYDFQIRCIRRNLTGQWSEWGPITRITTVETVPTGKLETWWRILESSDDGPLRIQIMWKQLERTKANAEQLWYTVKSSSDLHETDDILCNTTILNCTISVPAEQKSVFIWAYNTAGASPETEITFTARDGKKIANLNNWVIDVLIFILYIIIK